MNFLSFYEVLVIDGVEIEEFHAACDAFHAGEYCVFVERDVMLPVHPRRSWTPTARTATVQLYPLGEFPEIAEEMMMLSHDHDGFTAEDYAEHTPVPEAWARQFPRGRPLRPRPQMCAAMPPHPRSAKAP